MTLELDLPPEVVQALGDDPEREAVEAVLLHLVHGGKVTLAWAGELLGMDRWQVVEWYVANGYPYPDLTEEEFERDVAHAADRLAGS